MLLLVAGLSTHVHLFACLFVCSLMFVLCFILNASDTLKLGSVSLKGTPVKDSGWLENIEKVHLAYVALHEVTWCMVVWYTQNVPRWQQFIVTPAMPAL